MEVGCLVRGGGAVLRSLSCSCPHKALPSGLEFCYSVGVILAPRGYEERLWGKGRARGPGHRQSLPLLPRLPAGRSLALGSHMGRRQT